MNRELSAIANPSLSTVSTVPVVQEWSMERLLPYARPEAMNLEIQKVTTGAMIWPINSEGVHPAITTMTSLRDHL
jgi:hypothetical protein